MILSSVCEEQQIKFWRSPVPLYDLVRWCWTFPHEVKLSTCWMSKWVIVSQLCPTLCDPMDYSLPGSSVRGILQARILEWVTIDFSRGSSQPRDQTWVSHVAGRFFTIWATRVILDMFLTTLNLHLYVWCFQEEVQLWFYWTGGGEGEDAFWLLWHNMSQFNKRERFRVLDG